VVVRRWNHRLPDDMVEVPDGQAFPTGTGAAADMGSQEGRGAGDHGAEAATEAGGEDADEASEPGMRGVLPCAGAARKG